MRSLFSTNCLLLLIWQKYVISSQRFWHSCGNILKQEKVLFASTHRPLGLWFLGYDPEFGSAPSDRKLAGPPHWFLTGSLGFGGWRGGAEFCPGLGWALCLAPQPVTASSRNLTDRGCLVKNVNGPGWACRLMAAHSVFFWGSLVSDQAHNGSVGRLPTGGGIGLAIGMNPGSLWYPNPYCLTVTYSNSGSVWACVCLTVEQ